jgi:hypothetical protein
MLRRLGKTCQENLPRGMTSWSQFVNHAGFFATMADPEYRASIKRWNGTVSADEGYAS